MKKNALKIIFIISLIINLIIFFIYIENNVRINSSNEDKNNSATPECLYNLKHFDFHYKLDPDSINIIMIGNSLIRWGDWDSLMQRNDILNRGISGDHLHCICERLKYLENTNAKLWIIEGGINDINSINETNINQLYNDFVEIIEFAKSQKSIPVVNLLLYINKKAGDVWEERKNYQKINEDVRNLNMMLIKYCDNNNIKYIDLNNRLSSNNVLRDEFTTDGVHLNENAYKIWADELKKIISYYDL